MSNTSPDGISNSEFARAEEQWSREDEINAYRLSGQNPIPPGIAVLKISSAKPNAKPGTVLKDFCKIMKQMNNEARADPENICCQCGKPIRLPFRVAVGNGGGVASDRDLGLCECESINGD